MPGISTDLWKTSQLTGNSEGHLNINDRSTRDAVIVMNPDTLEFNELSMRDFTGTADDGIINLTGFAGVDKPDGSIELFFTNARPSVNPSTGQVSPDQAAVGANSTIEVFRTGPQAEKLGLKWVRTIADPMITTPNRVAAAETGIYLTNDHGASKIGLVRHSISPRPAHPPPQECRASAAT